MTYSRRPINSARYRAILEMEADRSFWLGIMTDESATEEARFEASVCECLCRARIWELKQGYYDHQL